MRTTHTVAVMKVPKSVYDLVAAELRAAGYDHAFLDDGSIDMTGVALAVEKLDDPSEVTTEAG